MMDWKHDDLAADLAQYLRSSERMVWTDMQLGPSGSPRPDVYTLEKSYSRPQPTAYECKISRSDLRSDTTSGKWQKYLAFAGAVIFAVPEGLCTPADIPPGCGLIVRKAQVWRIARKATRGTVVLPMDACMKLLIDGVNRTVGQNIPQPRHANIWSENKAVRKKFGEAVAVAARDLTRARQMIADEAETRAAMMDRINRDAALYKERMMANAAKEVAEYEAAKRELCDWLGIDHKSSSFVVRRKIVELRSSCSADARVQDAEDRLQRARRSLAHAVSELTPPATSEAA
jgi:hypothetical protein